MSENVGTNVKGRHPAPPGTPSPVRWERLLARRTSKPMSDDDKAYFQQRAEAEIALAQKAEHPEAARSHYLLAGHYLDLVHSGAVASEHVRPMASPSALASAYRWLSGLFAPRGELEENIRTERTPPTP
jgi:hypothetical protein